MKLLKLLILFGISASLCTAGDSKDRLMFKANGFSIAPLEGVSKDVPYQTIIMFLPPTESFSPNVNVQIQPYNGTVKQYAELSRTQFKTAGFKVLTQKLTAKALLLEYSGTVQGRELHWYAEATLSKGKVYLVTATATESQWKAVGSKLKACVNSFKLEKGRTKK